jgi:hypothetical protein
MSGDRLRAEWQATRRELIDLYGARAVDHIELAVREALAADERGGGEGLCGAPAIGGPCVLPRAHNMGHADVPENHAREALYEIAGPTLLEGDHGCVTVDRMRAVAREALAADERGGGEGLDVERLAQALSTWSQPLQGEGDPDFVPWAAQLIRAHLAAAQPASHAAEDHDDR